MFRTWPALLVLSATAVSMTACGSPPAGSPGPRPDAESETLVSREDFAVPTPARPLETAYSGRIEAGAEAGCWLLRTADERTYVLVGEIATVRAGDEVTLRARLDPERVMSCNAGPVLVVSGVDHP